MDVPLGLDDEDARGVLVGGGTDAGRAGGVAGVDVDERDTEAVEVDRVGALGLLGGKEARADVEGGGDARAGGAPEGGHRHADGTVGKKDEKTAREGGIRRRSWRHKLLQVNELGIRTSRNAEASGPLGGRTEVRKAHPVPARIVSLSTGPPAGFAGRARPGCLKPTEDRLSDSGESTNGRRGLVYALHSTARRRV